jgi:phosphoglycolate phosphatase-like HAD superfamily hydrolase
MSHYSNVDHVIFDLDGTLLGKYVSTVLQDFKNYGPANVLVKASIRPALTHRLLAKTI